METRHSKQVNKLYKEQAMVFPQYQAVKDNDYDCLVENNLEMYKVMILHKKIAACHDGFKMHIFQSIVYHKLTSFRFSMFATHQ